MKLNRITVFLITSLFLYAKFVFADEAVFDMHMHYKWSQKEVTTPQQAIQFLDDNNIDRAVVIGKPPELALEIRKLAPKRIIALYSPYRDSGDWFRWQGDQGLPVRVEEALKSGQYQGIGELHIIGGGFARKLDGATVLNRLMKIAAKHRVPIMLHTEFSRPVYMLALCKKHPDTSIIWAHAGAILRPQHVDQVLAECPNVHAGMAARDPWRYLINQHTDEDGKLLPEWKALFLKYPDRFMVGSDTVWPVDQLDSWDEPDTGWQQLGRFWDFHRSWLKELPVNVANRLKRENAAKLFNVNE